MNILSMYVSVLYKVMHFVGMEPKDVEIEPGTVLHFLAPIKRDPKKPNVVLLHGFAGDALTTWQLQIVSLAKKYNIYVPDLLFFGKSYTNKSGRTTRFQADCLAKGLRKLGIEEKCIIVGFSYGGFVSFQLAEYYPDLVGSMIVSGSYVAWTDSLNKKALKRNGFTKLTDILLPVSSEGVKKLLDVGSYEFFPTLPKFFYKHFLEIMFNNRKERHELLDALVIPDEEMSTHQFHQTIHLIWGSEDKMADVDAAVSLQERLGGKGRLQIIKKAGHLVLQERPFVFNKYLKEMLSSLALEAS